MELLWWVGLILVVVATVAAVLIVQAHGRRRRADEAQRAMDLFLDDLGRPPAPPKSARRHPEFVDDTAPAVLSVPPELENPAWEQQKRPRAQRWLH